MTITPKPGDEVLIRGRVVEHLPGLGTLVELFSKTDQYQAWVRLDLIAEVVLPDVPAEPGDGTWLAATGEGPWTAPRVWYRRDADAPNEPDRRWRRRWFDVAIQDRIDWPEVVRRGGDPQGVLYVGHEVPPAEAPIEDEPEDEDDVDGGFDGAVAGDSAAGEDGDPR